MTTGKTIALTRQTFAGKVMSLLFNMLSRLVITFLPSLTNVWLFASPWSFHGILQARILLGLPFPFPGGLPDPGIEPGIPALQADSLPSECTLYYFPSAPSWAPKSCSFRELAEMDHFFFPFSVSGVFFLSSSFEKCKLQKHGSVHLRAFEVMRTLVAGWMKKQEHPSMFCWVLGVYPSPVSVSRLIWCHIIVNPLQSHRSASPQWVLPPTGIFCGLKPYVILPNRQYEPQSKSHV